ncbi:alpha/beta fold hydrolase [Paraferrimonas sedimenticola]|uniref:AB hydrolase-1 domain-containing protein n=1 Tax=Paraferrimonas sedimenticola TaxID=375674 RepID=A0AA37RW84_9GAMM|nr:alpha/beta hydrolase [Paraferrimonas sedimenticola]GLP96366.1 hypothetical protein GCM10007895_16720 [Paraferrimonas sedimenticola]
MLKRLFRGLGMLVLGLLLVIVAGLGVIALTHMDKSLQETQQALRVDADSLNTLAHKGTELVYQVEGQGQPIVLIHSHFFSMKMWDQYAERLSQNYQVIRFDLTSHGLTGPESNHDYSMNRDLELLDALVEHLQLDDLVLVGSSLGGNIAINYTSRYPQKVKALVLQNSGGFRKANSRGGRGEDMPGWADYLLYAMPTMAYDAFFDWMTKVDMPNAEQHKQDFASGFLRKGNRYAEMQRIRQFKTGDTAGLLQSISQPVMIQWGEQNPQLPVVLLQQFENNLTQSQHVISRVYPGVGHVLSLEAPISTVADVQAFIEAVPSYSEISQGGEAL